MQKRITAIIASLLLIVSSVFVLASCDSGEGGFGGQQNNLPEQEEEQGSSEGEENSSGESKTNGIEENGTYDQKEDVAEYLRIYKKLPRNYIKKKEAKKLGWQGGSVEQVAPGKAIGGDHFGNYEKKLPVKKGRNYYECDIDTLGRTKRGAKRIIYSDDGLIYYTDNHYKSFEKMPQSA